MALTITDSNRQGETVSLSLRFPHTAYPVTVVAHQGEIDRVLAVLREGLPLRAELDAVAYTARRPPAED